MPLEIMLILQQQAEIVVLIVELNLTTEMASLVLRTLLLELYKASSTIMRFQKVARLIALGLTIIVVLMMKFFLFIQVWLCPYL